MSVLRRVIIAVAGSVGALFGAAAAFLIAGLNTPALLAGALVGGLVYGSLWWQQGQLSGQDRRWQTRRLGLALLALPVILAAAFAGGTLYALYNAGQILVPTDDRPANFDRLWVAVRDNYPYFDIKDVDWNAVGARYRPLVAAASTDEEYHALVAELLFELQDGHSFLAHPHPAESWRFGTLADVDGQAVIAALDDVARAAGLARGDVVTAVDGRSLDDAIAALHPTLRVASTPWGRRWWGLQNLLVAWDGARELAVTVRSADGDTRTVTLAVPEAAPAAGDPGPLVMGHALPSGTGVIRIPTFGGNRQTLVAEFDAALDALMDAPALIFDVRGNGGGNSLTASEMAGRLLADTFEYAYECYPQRLPAHMWLGCSARVVYPRAPRYDGPVVALIDAGTGSSAEEFVLMLVESGRGLTAGRTSGGTTGNPLAFSLTGDANVRFSNGDLRRMDGQRLESAGITPDAPVSWTVEDWRAGRDPDIAAAEQLLAALTSGSG